MTIRAVVFDIGGVLAITPDSGIFERWGDRLHLKTGEFSDQLERAWHGGDINERSEEDLRQSLIEVVGLDQTQADEFIGDFWEWYLGTPNVALIAYFASLRPTYQTAIISNSFTGARRREQERYGFEHMTDFIIYSHEVGLLKPDRRIYELTLNRLGVRPDEMIFVDDHPPNIVGANECGIHGILYEETSQTIADIQACLEANTP